MMKFLIHLLPVLLLGACAPRCQAQCLAPAPGPIAISVRAIPLFDNVPCDSDPWPSLLVGKSASYRQVDESAPTLQSAAFNYSILIRTNASTPPADNPAGDYFATAYIGTPVCPVGGGVRWMAQQQNGFVGSSIGEIDAVAPEGRYSFGLSAWGASSDLAVDLPKDGWPTAPYISNYTEAQAIDSTRPFTIRLAGTQANTRYSVLLIDVFSGKNYSWPCTNSLSTEWPIPANALSPGLEWRCIISASRPVGEAGGSGRPVIRFGVAVGTISQVRTVGSPSQGALVLQPARQTVSAGGGFSITMVGPLDPSSRITWYRNGRALNSERLATLHVASATADDAGEYQCVATTVSGSTRSGTASVDVEAPLKIVVQPAPATVAAGAGFRLSVVVSPGSPARYQWFKDGVPVATQVGPELKIDSAMVADSGKYSVIILRSGSVVSSRTVRVEVEERVRILAAPRSVKVAGGRDVTLRVVASGSKLHYHWYKNGRLLRGKVTDRLELKAASRSDAGSYQCGVYNDVSKTRSKVARVSVK